MPARLATLLDEHARIREMADSLETIIHGRRPEDATAFWRLRWSLLSLILQNLRHEQTHVIDVLRGDPRPGVAAIAERFEADLADFSKRYLDHIIRWDSDEGMVEWTRYGDQAQPLLEVLRARMAREEQELFPLLWPPR